MMLLKVPAFSAANYYNRSPTEVMKLLVSALLREGEACKWSIWPVKDARWYWWYTWCKWFN